MRRSVDELSSVRAGIVAVDSCSAVPAIAQQGAAPGCPSQRSTLFQPFARGRRLQILDHGRLDTALADLGGVLREVPQSGL